MAVEIQGSGTANKAKVDAQGNMQVTGPLDTASIGLIGNAAVIHDGTTGAAKLVRKIGATHVGNIETSIDSLLWEDTFNHGQFNSSKYSGNETTMTKTVAGGFLNFNAGNNLASGSVARVQTYKTFPIYGGMVTIFSLFGQVSIAPIANSVIEWGLGYATGVATPTDGIFFRIGGAGQFLGVTNFNGSETTVNLGADPSPNTGYYWKIVMSNKLVEFWRDDVLLGTIARPASTSAMTFTNQLPVLIRQYNSAAVGSAQQFKVSKFMVRSGDLATNRLWPTVQAAQGNASINIPDGVAAGGTVNYANSAAPVSATLSNTAAGYTTLGGQWQFAAVAGAETDYALFGYQVPAGSATVPAKTLIIRGIRIETFNTVVAVATTAHVFQWALGVGSTAVSLATADSATAGTRAARRVGLGVQSLAIGAAAGAQASPIDVNFDAPLVCEAGSFVHVILKMPIATATATQVLRGLVIINGYFE